MRALSSTKLIACASLILLADLSAAQYGLGFVSPDQSVSGNGLPYYTIGQNVNVTWTTSLESTTLKVYQQRNDSSFAIQLLAGTVDQMYIRRRMEVG